MPDFLNDAFKFEVDEALFLAIHTGFDIVFSYRVSEAGGLCRIYEYEASGRNI